jgi:hypothetical protein
VPKAQREAAVPPSWQDWSLADSGHHLGHGPAAVAGLFQLGLQQLRGLLREAQQSGRPGAVMNPPSNNLSARDKLLQEVLADYLSAAQAGQAPRLEELLAQYPHLAAVARGRSALPSGRLNRGFLERARVLGVETA